VKWLLVELFAIFISWNIEIKLLINNIHFQIILKYVFYKEKNSNVTS